MTFTTDYQQVEEEFLSLIEDFDEGNQEFILKAFNLAKSQHSGQDRDEGAPYIIHPVRVATYLIDDLNITNKEIIAAALLHDTVEDTDLTLTEIQHGFGDRVTMFVQALTRIKEEETKQEKFEKTLQKNDDIRLIKSVDWLDNARSWQFIPKDHQTRQKFPRWFDEAETMYIPLAKTVNQYIAQEMQTALDQAKQS